jgi:hypothetical protein
MNASARIETEAEAVTSLLLVNERLVTNYDAASKRPTAPWEQRPTSNPSRRHGGGRSSLLSGVWRQMSPGAGYN